MPATIAGSAPPPAESTASEANWAEPANTITDITIAGRRAHHRARQHAEGHAHQSRRDRVRDARPRALRQLGRAAPPGAITTPAARQPRRPARTSWIVRASASPWRSEYSGPAPSRNMHLQLSHPAGVHGRGRPQRRRQPQQPVAVGADGRPAHRDPVAADRARLLREGDKPLDHIGAIRSGPGRGEIGGASRQPRGLRRVGAVGERSVQSVRPQAGRQPGDAPGQNRSSEWQASNRRPASSGRC